MLVHKITNSYFRILSFFKNKVVISFAIFPFKFGGPILVSNSDIYIVVKCV
jgi:hypothetical protein